MLIKLGFSVEKGHQVASGNAKDSPYKHGTIALQKPFFKSLGLDLSNYYSGTINAKFSCQRIDLIKFIYLFEDVTWLEGIASETFYFSPCKIEYRSEIYNAYVYQPDKKTKIAHFQQDNVLELIAHKIPDLHYNDQLSLIIDKSFIEIKD